MVLAALLVGAVAGIGGRFMLPGGHPVSRRATLICGLAGAGVGLVVGVAFSTVPEVIVGVQLGVALALVWGYARLAMVEGLHGQHDATR